MGQRHSSLGLRQATLSLADHDPEWPALYEKEATLIARALPDVTFEIDHIGSTAVPGLPAKPILDITMRAVEQEKVAEALVGLGYVDRGMRSGRLFIRLRDDDIRTHNLHLYQPDDPDYLDQIIFRNALRADPDVRAQYTDLKESLVRRLGDAGRGAYAAEKTDFVTTVVRSVRAG